MHLDVLDLRAFYYRTKLGRTTQRALQDALRGLWPETRAMTVVGFGFAAPMLRPFLADARRVVALMPAQQGVMHWPVGGPNVSALVEETRWPIETGSVDRLIVAHGLETCERPDALLAEIWRVLAPQGQAAFIVPNRSGLWARREGTPFGFGRPYTFGQVEAILDRHGLAAGRHAAALYAPPSHRRFWLQTAHLWERLGRRFDPHLVAGALLVEATKQVYARPRPGAKASILGPLEALEGLARPRPEPVRGRAAVAARNSRAGR
ncbi:class I SAM-dependent methyltransferase [Amaricoccus sp.]|uniref:class I SAM-dependent methyltransferase n=1 Tax=Amaricoccus sp. TaxID=1872485 RepID=UPI001B423BF0|nr:methyltransferase domain-containing protein [Amaricoccus sp.]MBP7000385.1 methyltransferase domain-containing protein [Amaricoccus sp.]